MPLESTQQLACRGLPESGHVIIISREHLAAIREKAILLTGTFGTWKVRSNRPVAISQRWAVLSLPPVSTISPSGEKVTAFTPFDANCATSRGYDAGCFAPASTISSANSRKEQAQSRQAIVRSFMIINPLGDLQVAVVADHVEVAIVRETHTYCPN